MPKKIPNALEAHLQPLADLVLQKLQARYPEPDTLLEAQSPWQLMIATILAAQCTDARVNMVTPVLFARWPDPYALAMASVLDVEKVIRSTGFYHNKARHLVEGAKLLIERHQGQMPSTMQELIALPGVARKTANIVLWEGFRINEGLAVDTHVKRICFRLGLTKETDPVRVEKDLMRLFPQCEWGNLNHRLVWFGRHVCHARSPLCTECEMREICAYGSTT